MTSRNLTIFAEPNMAVALTKIARIYSQKNNVIVSLNFNSAANLVSEIEGEAPVDILICAHDQLIGTLRNKGLVDVYNIGYFVEDNLVLVTSSNNKEVAGLVDNDLNFEATLAALDQNKAVLIVDNEGTSLGKFSGDLIKKLKLENLKIFTHLAEDKTPIFDLVKKDSSQYSILLASQANNLKDIKILAVKKDFKIFYQALVIAGENMENSREFLKFLKSSISKEVLRKNGFEVN